jgi:tetratricopeptide (TPR) repeat protein
MMGEVTHTHLMDRALIARREHRLNDAHRDLFDAVLLCRQNGTPLELVQVLKALGQIERDLGQPEAALRLYEEAGAICRHLNDPLMLAHTIRHVGDIQRNLGRLSEAQSCYDEALTIYRNHDPNPLDLANALRPLALLKEAIGQKDQVRALWEEARNLYAIAGVEAGVAECTARLSAISSVS